MKINDLIQALAEQGITATEAEIKAQLGDISKLDPSDIPTIAELWKSDTSTSKLSKPKAKPQSESGSIAKLDANHLPEVTSLNNTQIDAYIAQIEQMEQSGESIPDSLVAFLCDLYDRRQQAIELAVGAVQRFKAQDVQLNQAMSQLNAALGGSVQGLQDAQQQLAAIGEGGARLGDNFRSRTQRWQSAADRFTAHCNRAGQSRVEAESSVA